MHLKSSMEVWDIPLLNKQNPEGSQERCCSSWGGRELVGEGGLGPMPGSCLLGAQSSVTGGGTSCSWKFSF